MKKVYYYILFDNHQQAIVMKRQLKESGINVRISPTPRVASICCGVSLMIDEEKMNEVNDFIENNKCEFKSIHRVEQDFNGKRDVYC